MKLLEQLLKNKKFIKQFRKEITQSSERLQSELTESKLQELCEKAMKDVLKKVPPPKIYHFGDFAFNFSIAITCDLGYSYEQFMAETDFLTALKNLEK